MPTTATAHRGGVLASGLRIPYITAYEGEKIEQELVFDRPPGGPRLSHRKPRPLDWEFGVLRVRERTDRQGRPNLKAVNSRRQWECMIKGLCQVCGHKAQDQAGRWPWLLSAGEADDLTGFTNAPPTCAACIPDAIAQCPHLWRGATVLTVADYEPYAVKGHLFLALGTHPYPSAENKVIPLDAFAELERALATQLLVRFFDPKPAPELAP